VRLSLEVEAGLTSINLSIQYRHMGWADGNAASGTTIQISSGEQKVVPLASIDSNIIKVEQVPNKIILGNFYRQDYYFVYCKQAANNKLETM
jgi:hypothetical protein